MTELVRTVDWFLDCMSVIILRDIEILNITLEDRSAGQVRQPLLTIFGIWSRFQFISNNGRLEGRRDGTFLSAL